MRSRIIILTLQLNLLEGKSVCTIWGIAVVESQMKNYKMTKDLFNQAIAIDQKNHHLLYDAGFSRVQENLAIFEGEPVEEKKRLAEENFRAAGNSILVL